jgi:hypothetical protein
MGAVSVLISSYKLEKFQLTINTELNVRAASVGGKSVDAKNPPEIRRKRPFAGREDKQFC